MDKSKGELISDALVASGFTVVPWRERGSRERAQLEETANEYDKATAVELPPDILAFVAEVEAQADRLPIVGASNARKLIAIVREQAARIATLEAPDGENLYEGCLCGEISPEDKPCLTCAARLSQWDAMEAELTLRRKRRFIGRHEEETGVYCGDYNQHRETGWACNACGVVSGNEHDACENCDNAFIRLENNNAALRERLAKLESEGAAMFASEQAAVRLATEASALAVSSGERLAKLDVSDQRSSVSATCPSGKHALTWSGSPEKPNYYACNCKAKCHPDCEWCT